MEGTVLDSVFEVFSAVATWLTDALASITPMFYANGSLTFLGVLAVAGLGISVVFLLIGIIQKFLHFAG